MAAIITGTVIGFALGAGWFTPAGGFVGALIGMSIGASIHAALWLRAHSGSAPTVEQHRLICTPRGTFADVELQGDLRVKRWIDVRECSLEPDGVVCDKTCMTMMNDARVRPDPGRAHA